MRVVCVNCSSREVGHWCSHCGAVLPTPDNENYFSILGLPQKINLDEEILKERFFDLNRAFHPDRSSRMKDPRMRDIATRKSTLINNSFNTLRDRTRRIQYLIRQGLGDREEKSGQIPLTLFDLVERVNDLMVELKEAKESSKAPGSPTNGRKVSEAAKELEGELQELVARREAFESNLHSRESEWDDLCDHTENFERLSADDLAARQQILQALSVRMDEISYIDSLIRRIKDTLFE
ncbi:MAG: DnaJ domain-containing protein [Acidobacteriia bacterium]|nr:DnaJ domain-containing protein [Terriglobia bacterium]